jgi:hypothetical protein
MDDAAAGAAAKRRTLMPDRPDHATCKGFQRLAMERDGVADACPLVV